MLEDDTRMENGNLDSDSEKHKVLIGIFETEKDAVGAIRQLKDCGYLEDEITVISKDRRKMEIIADTTTVGEEAQNAGLTGVLPAFGMLQVPGAGGQMAAGSIPMLDGGVVIGGVTGGSEGSLVKQGVDEGEAKEYEKHIQNGKVLVMVDSKEGMDENVCETYRQNNSILHE